MYSSKDLQSTVCSQTEKQKQKTNKKDFFKKRKKKNLFKLKKPLVY